MSEQLLKFTEESWTKAKRGQAKWAWVMLAAIFLIVFGFFGAPVFILLGILLVVVASAGWSISGKRIQRLQREHLEAMAAAERGRS